MAETSGVRVGTAVRSLRATRLSTIACSSMPWMRSKQNRLGSQLQRLGVAALPDAMPAQTQRVVRALAFGVQDVSVSGLLAAPPSP